MFKFTFELSHDTGKLKMSTWASSQEQAKKQIIDFENCPASALKFLYREEN